MPGIDRDLLNYKIRRANMTNDSVAKDLGIDRSTFYRHVKEGTLTINEMQKLASVLNLSANDAMAIFLGCVVA